ncbi:hypothetical protein PMI05_00560 [Brevibacillus sp. BC25]|nr:hypothetical protein PMI05_00560 [Brevibacillus sp. BC25]
MRLGRRCSLHIRLRHLLTLVTTVDKRGEVSK